VTAITAPRDRAAPGGQHVSDPQHALQRLTRALALTPAEIAQIRPILTDQAQAMEQLRADASLDPATRRQRMRALREGTHQRLQAVLSHEQRARFAQLLQQKHRHDADPPPANAGNGG
jgi:hypothetical protein